MPRTERHACDRPVRLAVGCLRRQYIGTDAVTINVYNNPCEAAQSLPGYVPPVGDLNGDCRVDELDRALLEEHWLEDSTLTDDWFAVE